MLIIFHSFEESDCMSAWIVSDIQSNIIHSIEHCSCRIQYVLALKKECNLFHSSNFTSAIMEENTNSPKSRGLLQEYETLIDLTSGYNLCIFSFLLEQFLPAKRIEDALEKNKFLEAELIKKYEATSTLLPSGSLVEGFSVPIVVKHGEGYIEEVTESDLDLMVVKGGGVYEFKEDHEKATEVWHILVENDPKFPGYEHLFPSGDCSLWLAERLTFYKGRIYLNSTVPKNMILDSLINFRPNAVTEIAGPAIKTIRRFGAGWLQYYDREIDYVESYKVDVWPSIAHSWRNRKRTSGWPSTALVERIISSGCHLVCIGHSQSEHPELHFRWSFSQAEKMLAHSLNPTQRQAYILLKLLRGHMFHEPKLISSYYLKNIFYWTCEELPLSNWIPENLGRCLFYLLDKLIMALAKKEISRYFIPHNNSISTGSRDHVLEVSKKVIKVRKDPIRYLLDFNKVYRFSWGPFYKPIFEALDPMLAIISEENISRLTYFFAESVSLKRLALLYLVEVTELDQIGQKKEESRNVCKEELSQLRNERFDTVFELLKENWLVKKHKLKLNLIVKLRIIMNSSARKLPRHLACIRRTSFKPRELS